MEPQERLALVTQVIPIRRLQAELELLGDSNDPEDNVRVLSDN
jgi:hypothetical protein